MRLHKTVKPHSPCVNLTPALGRVNWLSDKNCGLQIFYRGKTDHVGCAVAAEQLLFVLIGKAAEASR